MAQLWKIVDQNTDSGTFCSNNVFLMHEGASLNLVFSKGGTCQIPGLFLFAKLKFSAENFTWVKFAVPIVDPFPDSILSVLSQCPSPDFPFKGPFTWKLPLDCVKIKKHYINTDIAKGHFSLSCW